MRAASARPHARPRCAGAAGAACSSSTSCSSASCARHGAELDGGQAAGLQAARWTWRTTTCCDLADAAQRAAATRTTRGGDAAGAGCAVPGDARRRQTHATRADHDETVMTCKATLSFTDGSPTIDLPIYTGTIGPDVIDIRTLYAQDRHVHLRPGLPVHGELQLDASPTSTATRASCCTAATRSSSWRSSATSSKSATCC